MSLMPVSNEQTFSLDSTYVQDGTTKLRYYIPKVIWFWLLLSAKPYWISYRLPDMDRIKSCYLLNYLHEIDPIFFSKIHLRLPFLLQHYGSVFLLFFKMDLHFTFYMKLRILQISDAWYTYSLDAYHTSKRADVFIWMIWTSSESRMCLAFW